MDRVDGSVPVPGDALGYVAALEFFLAVLQVGAEPGVGGKIDQSAAGLPRVYQVVPRPPQGTLPGVGGHRERHDPVGLDHAGVSGDEHPVRARGYPDTDLRAGHLVLERAEALL